MDGGAGVGAASRMGTGGRKLGSQENMMTIYGTWSGFGDSHNSQ